MSTTTAGPTLFATFKVWNEALWDYEIWSGRTDEKFTEEVLARHDPPLLYVLSVRSL